jgi:hypothetical protein
MTTHLRHLLLLLLVGAAACLDMDVTNVNEPDAERALAEASDVEALLGTGYYRFWNATQKYNPSMAVGVAANEITSSWGNYGMQDMGTQPRGPWDNAPTYGYRAASATPWGQLYEAISNVSDGMTAINNGTVFRDSDGNNQTPRAEAYIRFVQGIAHGWLAMMFDQAIIFDETLDLAEGVPDPSPYPEVMAAAVAYLEQAIQLSEQNSFQLPGGDGSWINERPLTNIELAQWAHSYLARYLAGVARTPADRAAVDWNKVAYHAERGIQDEVVGVEADGSIWWWALAERPNSWIRNAYDLLGPADESGAYQAWRDTPLLDRNTFTIETSDRRIHGEDGPTSPGKYFRRLSSSPFQAARGNYFQSLYFQERFAYHRATQFRGLMPVFTRAEMDMLLAERLLRQGNVAAAVPLINKTRVANGEMEPLPTTVSEAEAWHHLKYEKLVEVANTQGGLVFWERRGWGDLVCGTFLHLPIPGAELEQLGIPNYTHGGSIGDYATPGEGCMP